MNDPTAQMGFQMGKNMAMAGQEIVEQNVRDNSPTAAHILSDTDKWLCLL